MINSLLGAFRVNQKTQYFELIQKEIAKAFFEKNEERCLSLLKELSYYKGEFIIEKNNVDHITLISRKTKHWFPWSKQEAFQ